MLDKLKVAYGDMYRADNVMISGTHTHSGVAGFHQYVLYLVTSLGFVRESYDNLVNGIVKVSPINEDNTAWAYQSYQRLIHTTRFPAIECYHCPVKVIILYCNYVSSIIIIQTAQL